MVYPLSRIQISKNLQAFKMQFANLNGIRIKNKNITFGLMLIVTIVDGLRITIGAQSNPIY